MGGISVWSFRLVWFCFVFIFSFFVLLLRNACMLARYDSTCFVFLDVPDLDLCFISLVSFNFFRFDSNLTP